jgi:hypothetical protein
MCTIISILNPNPKCRLLFLENRDRPLRLYKGDDVRKIKSTISLFDFGTKGMICGYSIKGKFFAAFTNAPVFVGNHKAKLLRDVLINSKNLDDAIKNLCDKLKGGKFTPGNFILGDLKKLVRIENCRKKIVKRIYNDFVVSTNNFRFIKQGKTIESSAHRARYIEDYIKTKKTIEMDDMIKLGKHHNGLESVCRHRTGLDESETVSSFIFCMKKDLKNTEFLYSIGKPCKKGYDKFICD